MLVLPQQFALGRAQVAFDETGGLRDARSAQSVQAVLTTLAALAQSMKTARDATSN